MKKRWYDYLWIASLLYLLLGFFNILFAWLGLLCFFIPLIISVVSGTKGYCNRYCGRGQLFGLLGGRFGLSRNTIHHHMSKLLAARLVTCTVDGNRVYYTVDQASVSALLDRQRELLLSAAPPPKKGGK